VTEIASNGQFSAASTLAASEAPFGSITSLRSRSSERRKTLGTSKMQLCLPEQSESSTTTFRVER